MSLFLVVLPVLSLLSLGQTAELPQPRIVGGEYVDILEYPFQVMLVIDFKTVAFYCGGVIISERWVLTTAHCLDDVDTFFLRMGISDVTDDGHVAHVKLFHCHEKFDGEIFFNDICLIKTVEPIPFSDRIQPIKLASRKEEERIKSVNGSGWGKTFNITGEPYGTFRLKAVTLSIVDYFQCIISISSATKAHEEYYLCTRDTTYPHPDEGGYGLCFGDSGGPIVGRTMGDNRRVLVALVSFGNCLIIPSLYRMIGSDTRVSAYLDWIDSVRFRFH